MEVLQSASLSVVVWRCFALAITPRYLAAIRLGRRREGAVRRYTMLWSTRHRRAWFTLAEYAALVHQLRGVILSRWGRLGRMARGSGANSIRARPGSCMKADSSFLYIDVWIRATALPRLRRQLRNLAGFNGFKRAPLARCLMIVVVPNQLGRVVGNWCRFGPA